MGQFSAEKPVPPGSTLSGNQQIAAILLDSLSVIFLFIPGNTSPFVKQQKLSA